jgi:alpha-tubulin suppressor-like RCC1 family protein
MKSKKRLALRGCIAGMALPMMIMAGNALGQQQPCDTLNCHSVEGGLLGSTRLLDTSVGIDADGNLWLWGYFGVWNYELKHDSGGPGGGPNGAPSSPVTNSDRAIYNPPTRFQALNNITGVVGTAYTVHAVDANGNLWAWGDLSALGGLTDIKGNEAPEKVPDGANQYNLAVSTWQPIAQNVSDVAAAEYATAYLVNGKVWTTGHNSFGQRGLGVYGLSSSASPGYPTQIPDANWPILSVASGGTGKVPVIVAVYDGYEGFMAQDDHGNIYAWGRSFESGLGTSGFFLNGGKDVGGHTQNNENFAYDPATFPTSTLAGKGGSVVTYSSAAGRVGNDWYVVKPIFIPEVTKLGREHGGIKEIILGYQHGIALTQDNSVLLWGSDEENRNAASRGDDIEGLRPYELCLDANGRQPLSVAATKKDVQYPVSVGCTPVKAKSITSNQFAGSFVTTDGKVYAWGSHLIGGAFGTRAQRTGAAPNATTGTSDERDGYENVADTLRLVWDPALDEPLYRKAWAVSSNKDASFLQLDDYTIWVWGENGGGAACAGYGYKDCGPNYWGPGTYGSTTPGTTKKDATKAKDIPTAPYGSGYYVDDGYGLYVWPPLPIGAAGLRFKP